MSEVGTVTREELKAMMERGEEFVLLEALSEERYRQGHLPGAIRFTDPERAFEVLPDRSADVIVYCSNFD